LHGNTGTRAHPLRTVLYTAFTARLKANVLVIDYRGFGDSEGHPTVDGVSKDARAGWDYLMSQGAKPEDVLILGHSLGTAIAGLLSAELGQEGIQPRGTVLMSVRRVHLSVAAIPLMVIGHTSRSPRCAGSLISIISLAAFRSSSHSHSSHSHPVSF
jgi:pimeloyl-ACP methyl ester carboxylesterase